MMKLRPLPLRIMSVAVVIPERPAPMIGTSALFMFLR